MTGPPEREPVSPPDRTPRLLLLTGRKAEHQPLRALEPPPEQGIHQNHPIWTWRRPDHILRVTHVGPGPESVISTLDKLRPLLDCDLLLIGGTAGALVEDLLPGTLLMVTASGTSEANPPDWRQPDPEVVRWLGQKTLEDIPAPALFTGHSELETNRFRAGALLSEESPVLDPDRRRRLAERTGAMAVDMETGWILDYLDEHVRAGPERWAGLRVVSDGLTDDSLETVRNNQKPSISLFSNALKRVFGLGGTTRPPGFEEVVGDGSTESPP